MKPKSEKTLALEAESPYVRPAEEEKASIIQRARNLLVFIISSESSSATTVFLASFAFAFSSCIFFNLICSVPSGTKPLVRVIIEGDDIEKITRLAEELALLLTKKFG